MFCSIKVINNKFILFYLSYKIIYLNRISAIYDVKEWDLKHKGAVQDPTFSPLVTLRKYSLKVMNIIDLIAILPFYIAFITPSGASLTIFRILRLGRILRLTKAGKNNSSMAVLAATIDGTKEILSMLFFYILLCVIVVAALVYQFELGDFKVKEGYPDGAYFRPTVNMDGEEVSPFVSIWAGIYWAIVTGTTVGYGDLYPTTVGGRLISCFWIFSGILILGIPISIIGSNFSVELEKRKKFDEERRITLSKIRQTSSQRDTSTQRDSNPLKDLALTPSMIDAIDMSVHTDNPINSSPSITKRKPNSRTQDASTQTPPEWTYLGKIERFKKALESHKRLLA